MLEITKETCVFIFYHIRGIGWTHTKVPVSLPFHRYVCLIFVALFDLYEEPNLYFLYYNPLLHLNTIPPIL